MAACHLIQGVHVALQLRWGGVVLLSALLQHVPHAHSIPIAVIQNADCCLAVPACSAGLLRCTESLVRCHVMLKVMACLLLLTVSLQHVAHAHCFPRAIVRHANCCLAVSACCAALRKSVMISRLALQIIGQKAALHVSSSHVTFMGTAILQLGTHTACSLRRRHRPLSALSLQTAR